MPRNSVSQNKWGILINNAREAEDSRKDIFPIVKRAQEKLKETLSRDSTPYQFLLKLEELMYYEFQPSGDKICEENLLGFLNHLSDFLEGKKIPYDSEMKKNHESTIRESPIKAITYFPGKIAINYFK